MRISTVFARADIGRTFFQINFVQNEGAAYTRYNLKAHDCKYRESLARLKKSKILIICLENPFREMYSKKIFRSLKNQMFPRKWGKTKIWVSN